MTMTDQDVHDGRLDDGHGHAVHVDHREER